MFLHQRQRGFRRQHLLQFGSVILSHLFPCERTRQPDQTHGVDIGPEDDAVDVPDEDRKRGKPRLVIMDHGREVDHQQGPALQRISLKPHNKPGTGHHDSAPYDRPVLQLLHVTETVETGPMGPQTQVKGYHAPCLTDVPPAGSDQSTLHPPTPGPEQIHQMVHGRYRHQRTGNPMEPRADRISSFDPDQRSYPPRIGKLQCEARDNEDREGTEQYSVLYPLIEREALDESARNLWRYADSIGVPPLRPPTLTQTRQKVKPVVQAHPADDDHDHHQVDSPNNGHPWMLAELRSYVDPGGGQLHR